MLVLCALCSCSCLCFVLCAFALCAAARCQLHALHTPAHAPRPSRTQPRGFAIGYRRRPHGSAKTWAPAATAVNLGTTILIILTLPYLTYVPHVCIYIHTYIHARDRWSFLRLSAGNLVANPIMDMDRQEADEGHM
jgi:hypothetical protein